MTTEELTIQRCDTLYRIVAATEFLINELLELERRNNGQLPFSMGLKNTAKKFLTQLTAAERIVTGPAMPGKDESMDQLYDSSELIGNLLTIHLKAGRQLTPQAQVMLSDELNSVALKWGVAV